MLPQKEPAEQSQHKIPQVYLKQFGYIFKEQHKLSVLQVGERFTRQKSTESFLAEVNHFDIESDDVKIPRAFEEMNRDLENEFHGIITDLETQKSLGEKSRAVLYQLLPNLICRSDFWREWILELLEHPHKENFLKVICAHHTANYNDFQQIHTKPFFRALIEPPPVKSINRVLLFFMQHLLRRISQFEIVILESRPGKPWFTSDNPVIINNRMTKNEFLGINGELYFPISPKYLAYLHHKSANDKANKLRAFKSNKIYRASNKLNVSLQQKILNNAHNFVIIAGEFKYRYEENP